MVHPPMTPTQYRIGIGVGGFIVLSGVALLVFGISFLRQAYASQSWPVSPGTVAAVKIVQERATSNTNSRVYTYHYTVDYTYEVEGQAYRGDRYSLGSGSTASQRFRERNQAVEAARLNHPKGSAVEVHYDPDHPESAVLEAGANWGTYVPLILGVVFLPTGLILLSLAFKQNTSNG